MVWNEREVHCVAWLDCPLTHCLNHLAATWKQTSKWSITEYGPLTPHQCCIVSIAERAPKCLFLFHQIGSLGGRIGVLASKNCCQDMPLTFQPAFSCNSIILERRRGVSVFILFCEYWRMVKVLCIYVSIRDVTIHPVHKMRQDFNHGVTALNWPEKNWPETHRDL